MTIERQVELISDLTHYLVADGASARLQLALNEEKGGEIHGIIANALLTIPTLVKTEKLTIDEAAVVVGHFNKLTLDCVKASLMDTGMVVIDEKVVEMIEAWYRSQSMEWKGWG